ncbi:MAG: hypothetical protein WCY86_02490, partial [Spirosomataceae bacterium]
LNLLTLILILTPNNTCKISNTSQANGAKRRTNLRSKSWVWSEGMAMFENWQAKKEGRSQRRSPGG